MLQAERRPAKSATTVPSMRPPRQERATGGTRRGWLEPLGFTSAAAMAILLLYLLHPALEGFRYPIGPDGPVYTWLARLAGAVGFGDAPGGGPGVSGVTLTLGSVLGTDAVQTVMVLGPLLAAACGLGAGAVLEAAAGEDRLRTSAGVVLTGAFAAFLAGGWLANVAMVAMFLVALAALSRAGTSSRAAWAGAALLAAAALTHRIFGMIGAVIVLGAALWELLESSRGRRASASGKRLAAAALGGPGSALLLGAWIAAGAGVPGDTSQDGFFRRAGLRELLLDRYRERFVGDATRAAVPILAGVGLASPWAFGPPEREPGARFLREVLAAWALLSVAGILVLTATGWGPPYRLVQFAFFLPLAAAVGFAILARRSRATAVVAVLGAGVLAAAAMIGWFRQAPAFAPDELAVVASAGAATAQLPEDTPLLFVVDTDEPAAAYHVSRASNVIRMGVAPERIPDVRLAVGTPQDVVAGRATRAGDEEHDRISEIYLEEATPLLDEAAILVIREFNEPGFTAALGMEETVLLAEGLAAVTRGQEMRPAAGNVTASTGLGAVELLIFAVVGLLALGLLGWGWASWALPASGPRAGALAAPSVGIAVSVLGSVGADRLGLLPGGGGSLALTGALGLLGYVLSARATD